MTLFLAIELKQKSIKLYAVPATDTSLKQHPTFLKQILL